MTSSPQYLTPGAHHSESVQQNSLPDGSCPSGPPSTVAYNNHDMTPYSAVSRVSSFNQPAAVDATLLTPVSSAGSPPMQQQRPSKLRPYQQESATGSQQPTPPNTSTMYYGYEMNSSSQSSSPMNVQPQVSEAPFDIGAGAYLHHSPQDEPHPPPQNNPYFGHYSASNVSVPPNDPEPMHGMPNYQSFMPSIESTYGMVRHHSLQDGINGSFPQRTLAPAAQSPMALTPLLHNPNPSQYRRDSMLISRAPYHQQRHSPTLSKRPTAARKKQARSRSGTVKRESTYSPVSVQTSLSQDGSMGVQEADGGNVEGDEVMILDDKTPADDVRLWNLRLKYMRGKGKGMWDHIMKEWEEGLDDKSRKEGTQKATLQMKVTRMVAKHGVWPARERAALRRAYKIVEENRYIEIGKEFKRQLGPKGPCWDFKSQHIEAQLVKEGLEDKEVLEAGPKKRKRHHVPARHQRQTGSRQGGGVQLLLQQQPPPQHGSYYDLTGGAFDPRQHYQQQQSPEMRRSPYELMSDDMVIAPPLTADDNNRLVDNMRFEITPEPEEDEKMENAYPEVHLEQRHSLPSSTDVNAQRSAAVARQACGELMKTRGYVGSA